MRPSFPFFGGNKIIPANLGLSDARHETHMIVTFDAHNSNSNSAIGLAVFEFRSKKKTKCEKRIRIFWISRLGFSIAVKQLWLVDLKAKEEQVVSNSYFDHSTCVLNV